MNIEINKIRNTVLVKDLPPKTIFYSQFCGNRFPFLKLHSVQGFDNTNVALYLGETCKFYDHLKVYTF